jgi:hypothetical protein
MRKSRSTEEQIIEVLKKYARQALGKNKANATFDRGFYLKLEPPDAGIGHRQPRTVK